MDLCRILAALYASEINVGLQSFWDAGYRVWLGDQSNGRRCVRDFAAHELQDMPQWLDEMARVHYPKSDYATRERMLT